MKSILIYDDTERALEELAEELDTNVAEIIESLMEYIDDVKRDYGR